MGNKLDWDTIVDNTNAINEAYNAIAHPLRFKAFVSVKFLGDYTPPHNFITEAGIIHDNMSNGVWIDFPGSEKKYYSKYTADYQVFSSSDDIIIIDCETKYGDPIRITITPK